MTNERMKKRRLMEDEVEYIRCPVCGNQYRREDMIFSRDCHGIPFRLVCFDCLEKIYEENGYDGEYYTEADECIDYDY